MALLRRPGVILEHKAKSNSSTATCDPKPKQNKTKTLSHQLCVPVSRVGRSACPKQACHLHMLGQCYCALLQRSRRVADSSAPATGSRVPLLLIDELGGGEKILGWKGMEGLEGHCGLLVSIGVGVENLHLQTQDQAQTGKEFCLVSGRKEIKLGVLFIWGRGHVF